LDLRRLKEVLENFREEQKLIDNHSNFNLVNLGAKNNAEINRDLDSLQYSVPNNFGIEGSHLGLGHHKGSHIGMGIHNTIDDKSSEERLSHEVKSHPKGHHYIGEPQHLGFHHFGHLVSGPHGSLVVTPDVAKVEKKLDLDAESVQPNQEGMVISYENHHNHKSHHLQPPEASNF